MRKSREEAAATRVKIIETAARKFRARGIDGNGLADLMAAAGLTHGGFYRHFDSKDALVAAACGVAATELTAGLEKAAAGQSPALRHAVVAKRYLSKAHRDAPANGCPLAAMGSELARSDAPTREAATRGFEQLIQVWAGAAGAEPSDSMRAEAMVAACALVGALTMSRIVTDPRMSSQILEHMREHLEHL